MKPARFIEAFKNVPDNPLLRLRFEEIRALKFGERSVYYKTGKASSEISFASREERDRAVEEWFEQGRQRGEFFRLDAIKGLVRRRYQR